MIEAEAHAKINLRHRVFGRDETGFHGVETILARTSLTDTVRIEEGRAGISIDVDGAFAGGVPAGPGNLCWTAAERFLEAAFPRGRSRPSLRLGLTKRIPHGSGLGGGSADAAVTLRLLSERWPKLEERQLLGIAGEIGSDVAFSLLGVPMALGWERGRRLLPLRPPAPRPSLLLCPATAVSTPEAYEWLRMDREDRSEDPGGASVLPGPTRLARWHALERVMSNDLEGPVLKRHPEWSNALARLREGGSRAAAMTGSGSAFFAIFEDDLARGSALRALAATPALGGARLIEVTLPV